MLLKTSAAHAIGHVAFRDEQNTQFSTTSAQLSTSRCEEHIGSPRTISIDDDDDDSATDIRVYITQAAGGRVAVKPRSLTDCRRNLTGRLANKPDVGHLPSDTCPSPIVLTLNSNHSF